MSVFEEKVPAVMSALMKRFHLKDFQAAGVVGNLGHESGGLTHMREIGAAPGYGGYGWGQWTGPRAHEFLAWCKANGLGWETDAGNQGYLIHELSGEYRRTISALLKTATLEQAVVAFERNYERAGVVAMGDRHAWAVKALDAYRASLKAA